MKLMEMEMIVMEIAADELGKELAELKPETRLDSLFSDSLEYLDFTIRLAQVGHLSDEAISKAETLGDLANAIVNPN